VVEEELEKYGPAASLYLRVPPGLTGLWQISGRNDTSYRQRVELDTRYIHTWSIGLDLWVLWKTVRVVLRGHGAY
jgi:lipopolysaccharide/colanic/teichoic acid biosynthesis glycosyltransferase